MTGRSMAATFQCSWRRCWGRSKLNVKKSKSRKVKTREAGLHSGPYASEAPLGLEGIGRLNQGLAPLATICCPSGAIE
jgi:hypothetical protein